MGVAAEYTLTIIAGLFPHSIAANVGFIFTHVANSASFNFEPASLRQELRSAKMWTIDNSFARWFKLQKYLAANPNCGDSNELYASVQAGHRKTCKTFSNEIVSWLDHCSVQRTQEIHNLYQKTRLRLRSKHSA